MNLLTQSLILGSLGSAFFLLSCFSRNRNRILSFGIISSVLFLLSYLVKADFSATTMVVCALTRNILFLIAEKTDTKWMTRRKIGFIMIGLIIVAWTSTINPSHFQWYQIFILAGPILFSVGFTLNSIAGLKVFTILNGLNWLTYEIITQAYAIVIGEVAGMIFAGITLFRVLALPAPNLSGLPENSSETQKVDFS